MINIVFWQQTCGACPSQWDGMTDDHRPIYIRYRWGYLSLRLGTVGGDHWSAVAADEVYGKQIGDGLDGVLDFAALRERLRGIVEFVEGDDGKGKE